MKLKLKAALAGCLLLAAPADASVLSWAWNALAGGAPAAKGPRPLSGTPNVHEGIEAVDFSEAGLPKVRVGHRVVDVVHGGLFDDILQDTPDDLRPPSVVAFYDSSDATCMRKYEELKWDYLGERELPARERLFVARYDTHAAPRRSWYKFVPELDLAKRFDVRNCPEVVFVPRNCSGWNRWCSRGADPANPAVELVGCEDFEDQCAGTEKWDGLADLKAWTMARVRREGEPKISPFLRTYKEQGMWIRKRELTSVDNQMRNLYLAPAFPAFSDRGFKAMPIPKPFQDWLLDFYERHKKNRKTEFWNSESTQMSFAEIKTSFVDLDKERSEKERYANEYLKPLVEEWAGVPVTLTSFYGMREYPRGSFLKNHVDRIDTHVLSVTLSIAKLVNASDPDDLRPWPLEVIDWNGDHVRYEHPGGTMALYESAKLAHGRPYRNEGATHLGAFCHFSPTKTVTNSKMWDSVVRDARANKARHTENASYRVVSSVEPETPVFSDVSYGDATKWKHISPSADGAEDDGEENGANGGFSVKFLNRSPQAVDVYWVSPEGGRVHQGRLARSASFEINTFPMHNFVFVAHGSPATAPPLHSVTMEMGRTVYSFDGTPTAVDS